MAKTQKPEVVESSETIQEQQNPTASQDELRAIVAELVEEALKGSPFLQEMRRLIERLNFSVINLQRKADESHYRIDALIERNKLASEY